MLVEPSQISKAGRCMGMLWAENFLANLQGALIMLFGLTVLPLSLVERSQIVEAVSRIGVIRS